jgi:hypothetical protein
MPEVVARVAVGEVVAVISMEDDSSTCDQLVLSCRTQTVALMDDALRSPELRAMMMDADEGADEADLAPEDVAPTVTDDPPSV